MQHVSAPWLRLVSHLAGCAPEAPSDWPADRRRLVRVVADELEPEVAPEVSRADAAVLDALRVGLTSPKAIASHVRQTTNAVGVRLNRMAKRRLVIQVRRGAWIPAALSDLTLSQRD